MIIITILLSYVAANGDNSSGLVGPAFVLPLSQLQGKGVLPANIGAGPLEVLGAWYHLYCPQKKGDIDQAVQRHYTSSTTFEDNIIKVGGGGVGGGA